jgi:hypothetical protein
MREDGEVRGHESVLDHICVTKDLDATVSVCSDATTDHSPVVAALTVNRVAPTTRSMERRNFKALERPALLRALDTWPWSDVYKIRDPVKVLDFVTRGIVNGLDQAVPMKTITVKEGSLPLYLRPDTTLVRKDKEASNLAKLAESGNLPTVLWPRQPLPCTEQRHLVSASCLFFAGAN